MPTIRTAHPAATPAARALKLLATYQPVDADDAYLLLAALHEHGSDSVIARLLEAIDAQTSNVFDTPGIGERAAKRMSECLNAASEIISGASSDWFDRAREVLPEPQTGHDDGTPSWELSPAPAQDPNPLSADGWAMHSIAASSVREGDLLPHETWRTAVFVHDDREGVVQITLQDTDGRLSTLETVAASKIAVLRRAAERFTVEGYEDTQYPHAIHDHAVGRFHEDQQGRVVKFRSALDAQQYADRLNANGAA